MQDCVYISIWLKKILNIYIKKLLTVYYRIKISVRGSDCSQPIDKKIEFMR